jgi:hypothetical protein
MPSCSGPIDTNIFRDGEAKGLFNSEMVSAATLLRRMGRAEEVAKVLCFMMSDDASYVTGGEILMSESAFIPRFNICYSALDCRRWLRCMLGLSTRPIVPVSLCSATEFASIIG